MPGIVQYRLDQLFIFQRQSIWGFWWVYRGVHREEDSDGLSWTTERDLAEFYARRFLGKEGPEALAAVFRYGHAMLAASIGDARPFVVEGEVEPEGVHAFLTERGEPEIVSSNVNVLRVVEL